MSPSQIRAFFAPGGAARHVAVLTLGTALAQLINIAATPALSRIYSPSEFGLFAVFMAVSALAATFITFRYETSILVPASDTEAARLVRLILLLIAVGAVLLGLFSICWSLFEQQLPLLTSIRQWLPLVFLVAGCTAVMSTVQAWLNREKRYLRMAQLRVVQSGTIALTALFMGIVWELPHGLLLAQAVACGVTTAAACWFLRSAANLWHPGNLRDVLASDPKAARALLKKTWTLLFLMGALPLTLVYFFGEPLFEFLLGEDWREAGRLAVIMVPMILGMFLSSPTSGSYIVLNLQKYSLMFGVAVFVYRPFCLYIGYIQNDFILGVKLWVVFELIQIAIYQSLIWKKTGESSELFHRQKKA